MALSFFFTQTSRRSSHWCKRSAVREQYHALECCYFWVSWAENQLLPAPPTVIDCSLLDRQLCSISVLVIRDLIVAGNRNSETVWKFDWHETCLCSLSALCRPVGTPFEDGKLSRNCLYTYLYVRSISIYAYAYTPVPPLLLGEAG